MANKILIKRGTGPPVAGVLEEGELGLDKTTAEVYVGYKVGDDFKVKKIGPEIPLPVTQGGTGTTGSDGSAYENLGIVPISQGGTGSSTKEEARVNLGVPSEFSNTYSEEVRQIGINRFCQLQISDPNFMPPPTEIVPVAKGGTGVTAGDGRAYENLGMVPISQGGTGGSTKEEAVDNLFNGETVLTTGNLLNLIYPIGAIYLTINETNPTALFGGTWVKIENAFLLGSGTRTVGTVGGSETHVLTVNEMPSHTHGQTITAKRSGSGSTYASWSSSNVYGGTDGERRNTLATGGGEPHNNMPPFFTVHMWRRTA